MSSTPACVAPDEDTATTAQITQTVSGLPKSLRARITGFSQAARSGAARRARSERTQRQTLAGSLLARSEKLGLRHGFESPTGLDMKDRVGGLLRRAA